MTAAEFEAWPKIARLNRNIVITEKIDGTNAAILIDDELEVIGAQSRTRLITPDADNYGFARWVNQNAEPLAALLGPGRHFGEWWGAGIQRKYGLTGSDKRFSLFNTSRHKDADFSEVPALRVVPVLYEGPNDNEQIDFALSDLVTHGSAAAPGFNDPEGIVVFHSASRTMFKVTIKGDDVPKGAAS